MAQIQFVDGQILFVSNQIAMDPACCCGGPQTCSNCLDGTAPNQFRVVIAGMANNGCVNCANFNTTYALDYVSDCLYRYSEGPPSPCYALGAFTVELQINPATLNVYINGDDGFGGEFSYAGFVKNVVGADCNNLNTYDVPSDGLPDGSGSCNNSAATCKVTSL